MTPANAAAAAVPPHQTGAFSMDYTGDLRLSVAPGSTDRVTETEHACRMAIDASGAEQWMNTTKFGPSYHFQRWKFAP
jgi:hypothetical protein